MIRGILVSLTLLISFSTVQADSREFVVTGVVINSGSAKSISDFVNYLSQQTNIDLKPVFVDSYNELSSRLRKKPDSFGWNCGAPYVEDHQNDGQQLISVPLFNGKPTYHSIILTSKNKTGASLANFKDQVFVYSDPRSNSGYLAPAYFLMQQGLDIKNHFRIALHAGNHEKSIAALLNGLADIAAIDEYVWLQYIKKHPNAEAALREVQRLGPFPFTPIVTGNATNKQTLQKLQDALINMNKTVVGKNILNTFSMNGFVIKNNDFYKPIADMQRKLSKK